jgi:hypothetical protein
MFNKDFLKEVCRIPGKNNKLFCYFNNVEDSNDSSPTPEILSPGFFDDAKEIISENDIIKANVDGKSNESFEVFLKDGKINLQKFLNKVQKKHAELL